MSQLTISGALIAGPSVSGSDTFPASQFSVPLKTSGSPKLFNVGTGVMVQTLNSPSSLAVLAGVGAQAPVTRGDFLYLRTDSKIDLELTQEDGSSGTLVRVVSVHGLVMLEFPVNFRLTAMRAQGTARLEYVVTGTV